MVQNNFATGQCLCGEVTYTIFSAPVRMAQCHCDDCKKRLEQGMYLMHFLSKMMLK